MRGFTLPVDIALLLAAPLCWRIDTQLNMPNLANSDGHQGGTATDDAARTATESERAERLAVAPVAARDSRQGVEPREAEREADQEIPASGLRSVGLIRSGVGPEAAASDLDEIR